jgi:hypothetical protein
VLFDKTYSKISGEMPKEIGTLFDTEREVFCIINQHMVPSPTATGGKGWVVPPPTNYDWLPATIGVIPVKQGTSINVIDKRFEKYFETVGQWSFILNLYEEPLLKETLQQTYAQYALLLGRAVKILSFQLLPIAENKSKKIIAGTLVHKGRKGIGGIHLLPSPTKSDIKSAVEILLDLIYGQPTKTYLPWREEIEVPDIQDIMKQINLKFQDMKKIQESIEPLQSVIEELDTYRDLFSATGEDLEKIVQKVLSEIGIPTKKSEEGFPVDLISDKVAVEVTGTKSNVGVGSEKVNQIGRFKESFRKNEKIILIANTYMNLRPLDRKGKMDFTPEVKKYFDAIDVCYLTSKTLFELWKDIKNKKRMASTVAKTILSHIGELTLKDFGKS